MDRRSFVKSLVAGFAAAGLPKGAQVAFLDEEMPAAVEKKVGLQILEWEMNAEHLMRPMDHAVGRTLEFIGREYSGRIKVYAYGDGWDAIWQDFMQTSEHELVLPIAGHGRWKGKVKYVSASIQGDESGETIAELDFYATGDMEWTE